MEMDHPLIVGDLPVVNLKEEYFSLPEAINL